MECFATPGVAGYTFLMSNRRGKTSAAGPGHSLAAWRGALLDRRRFLLAAVGGSLAALFPLPVAATPKVDTWALIAAVQQQLFPSEAGAPGAADINALAYLQTMLDKPDTDPDERNLILQGASWLEDLALQQENAGFVRLDSAGRERLLERIAASRAGEHWLSTLLLYLFEALLSDPVYGGNPEGIGWRWLEITPGFPRPPPDKRYWLLDDA